MIYLREAAARGHANHGWLDSYHTFSFANYYDPDFMGFSSLRVINEDRVQPSTGFGEHPHKDMEILSYVLNGTIEHQDSMGHKEQIHEGEFQIMSAGTGIKHSEYNPSSRKQLHFYQIWIVPDEKRLKPRYETKAFTQSASKQLILSPDGRADSLKVFQDMQLWRWRFEQGEQQTYQLSDSYKHVWIQVVKGEVEVNNTIARAGDGLALTDLSHVSIRANQLAELLLFELTAH